MYHISILSIPEKRDIEKYDLHKLKFEDIEGQIDKIVENAMFPYYEKLKKLKEIGLKKSKYSQEEMLEILYYLNFLKEGLRNLASRIASVLREKNVLSKYFREYEINNAGLQEYLYRLFALYILEN